MQSNVHDSDRRRRAGSARPAERQARGTSRCIASAGSGGSGQSASATACASGTACRGRSTTPSWTASSSSGRPARPWHEQAGKWVGRRAGPGHRALAAALPRARPGSRTTPRSPTTTSQSANLVLWGDPSSNAVLKQDRRQAADRWTREAIVVGDREYPSRQARPDRRLSQPAQPDALRRAQQRLHLPRLRLPEQRPPGAQAPRLGRRRSHARRPTPIWPGKIADADFFDERWRLKMSEERRQRRRRRDHDESRSCCQMKHSALIDDYASCPRASSRSGQRHVSVRPTAGLPGPRQMVHAGGHLPHRRFRHRREADRIKRVIALRQPDTARR